MSSLSNSSMKCQMTSRSWLFLSTALSVSVVSSFCRDFNEVVMLLKMKPLPLLWNAVKAAHRWKTVEKEICMSSWTVSSIWNRRFACMKCELRCDHLLERRFRRWNKRKKTLWCLQLQFALTRLIQKLKTDECTAIEVEWPFRINMNVSYSV